MVAVSESLKSEYPWQGHTLAVRGGKLHYLDVGEGETLLFVHGNPTWSFYWRNLIKGLSPDYRCVAVDHIGCGLSDKPADWSYRLEDHIANLVALIEHLDLQKVTLVVHDWGGPIGLGSAINLPERIERIVIFNTGVFEGPMPLSIRLCRWPVLGNLLIQGANGFLQVGFLRAIADRQRLTGKAREGFLYPYRTWADRKAILRFIQDIPLEQDHPTRELFLAIDQRLELLGDRPVLLVWGEQDFCFTPDFRRGFMRRFPQAEVHALDDASHWVVEDAHERIVPWMRDFLRRHPLSGASLREIEG